MPGFEGIWYLQFCSVWILWPGVWKPSWLTNIDKQDISTLDDQRLSYEPLEHPFWRVLYESTAPWHRSGQSNDWRRWLLPKQRERHTHTHFVVYLCVVWKAESVEYPGGMSLSTQLSLGWYCMATKRTHCHLLSIERLLSLTLIFIEKFSPLPSQNENDSNNENHKNIRMKIKI